MAIVSRAEKKKVLAECAGSRGRITSAAHGHRSKAVAVDKVFRERSPWGSAPAMDVWEPTLRNGAAHGQPPSCSLPAKPCGAIRLRGQHGSEQSREELGFLCRKAVSAIRERVRERSGMPHGRACLEPRGAGGRDSYEAPTLADLQSLVWLRGASENHVDQVWPNLYLGDAWAARNKTALQSLNITHILNAAHGPYSINTGAKYYDDLQIEYYGIEAFDDPSFDLSIFFYDAANFIGKALNTAGGKVFVHCAMGVSRSASLVLAFLMIRENMTLVDALKTVGSHRNICPNSGFLSQLRDLDIKLNEERKGPRESASRAL
ncbi:PREDICTED: dual specificity protein phosphatase 13 isoform B-like [Tinamus guttatus]|nr:PREDICTED: dual specificity protein phosphatase 13 isoform B-like [Tinamus guttatus]